MRIQLEDARDFARGAAFLGTGGGGDPYIGRLLLEQALSRSGPAEVLAVDDLADDALVIPIAGMGAPTVIIEKIIGFSEGERVVRTLEARLGRKATAIMSAEIGGLNALYPTAMAAYLGLPVVDADGMGRAFPELQMVSFNVLGQRASPAVMCNEYGDTVVIESEDNHRVEKLARPVVSSMGGLCMLAIYPMSGRAVKACAIRDTLSLALGIGRAIGAARREQQDACAALFAYLRGTEYYRHCRQIFDGKIIDLRRETLRGWAIGHVALEDAVGKEQLTVTFRNEFLRAQRVGRTVAIVPDLISILDRETAEPITTENLKYGQRVKVVGASVPPLMRSQRALEVWGPRAFGFDEPFIPIESPGE
ncbi:MAG: DUF917 domain-containing protein [Steroidobacterales bacterium]